MQRHEEITVTRQEEMKLGCWPFTTIIDTSIENPSISVAQTLRTYEYFTQYIPDNTDIYTMQKWHTKTLVQEKSEL